MNKTQAREGAVDLSKNTKRLVRIMDLRNKPEVLEAYDWAHTPGQTPLQVLDAQRRYGILEMEIFRAKDRLVMIMEVSDAFNQARLDAEGEHSAEIRAWRQRMEELQLAPFKDEVAWPIARLVFRQSEHD